MDTTASQIVSEIEAAAKTLNVAPSTIGKLAGQGGHFYARLQSGARVWPETADSVRAKIAVLLSEYEARQSSSPASPAPSKEAG